MNISFIKYRGQYNDFANIYLLDCVLYNFYGLTYDEILIVDPRTPITK